MRTTITLEDGLFADLKQRAEASRQTMSEVIAEAVRAMLMNTVEPPDGPPWEPIIRGGGFAPGADPTRLGALLDEEDVERFLARQSAHVPA